MVISIIDLGIWWEQGSFNDEDMPPSQALNKMLIEICNLMCNKFEIVAIVPLFPVMCAKEINEWAEVPWHNILLERAYVDVPLFFCFSRKELESWSCHNVLYKVYELSWYLCKSILKNLVTFSLVNYCYEFEFVLKLTIPIIKKFICRNYWLTTIIKTWH